MAGEDPFDAYLRKRRGVTLPSAAPMAAPKVTKEEGDAQVSTAKGHNAVRRENAETENTESQTGHNNTQTRIGQRTLELPNLTPGQEETDKKFADIYLKWRSGDIGAYNKNLDQLRSAINILRSQKSNISGPLFGKLPEFIRTMVSPDSKNVRDDIFNAIQASLRQTLGAQFTEQEGRRLMEASFDPNLNEEDNLKRALRLVDELRSRGANTESMARYWEAKGTNGKPRGTLQGYTPADVQDILKLFPEETAAKAEPWLSPEQEQALVTYVNGDNVTAQGYADLLQRFAKDNGFSPLDQAELMRHGASIESRRKAGGTFAPTVDYSTAEPTPEAFPGEAHNSAPGPVAGSGGGGSGGSGMSWGDAGLQAVENLPASGFNFLKDTAMGIKDVMSHPTFTPSAGGIPGQFVDLFAQLGNSALGKFGITNADPALATALGKLYVDRYGGTENIKHTLANDPFGLMADASTLLTGMGGAGVRSAQLAGRVSGAARAANLLENGARVVQTAGRVIDPVSAVGGVVEGGRRAVQLLPQGVRDAGATTLSHLTQRYPAAIAALPSGVGGDTLVEAVGAGRQRSMMGQNPRSTAFTGQMRGTLPVSDMVDQLDAGVRQLRETASQRYQRDIAPITRDTTQLDFNPVLQAVARLRPRTQGLYTGRAPGNEAAWAQIDDLTRQHAALIAQDPATYATPAAVDAFKQRLYDTAAQFAEGNDRSSARIANQAYRAVRSVIEQQAPDYARVMRDYSTAQEHLSQIQRSLTVGGANRNIDGTVRRLQSILRRNDTGYAGQLLDDVNTQPASEVRASVAGREGNSLVPDRLRSGIAAGTALSTGVGALPFEGFDKFALLEPKQLATLALLSPRLTTETAYGLGRVGGLAERGSRAVWDGYDAAPSLSLAAANSMRAENSLTGEDQQQQQRRSLLKRYGISADDETQNLIDKYAGAQ